MDFSTDLFSLFLHQVLVDYFKLVKHEKGGKYLQSYFNEFCYKLNRRYFGNQTFYRLTLVVAKSYW